jgi:hypothetical protein
VWLWAVLALALALRLAAGVWWQSRVVPPARFEFGDSDAYWVLGQQLAHGRPFQYGSPDASVFRTPGYPLLLAGMFLVVGDDPPVLCARAMSALLGTLAVAAIYWLGRRLFDRPTGLFAAALAAVYPGAIAMSVVVLSEAPFCPLMVAQLAAIFCAWQATEHGSATGERRWSAVGWAALAGCLGGLATLMRPGWLLFTPLALITRWGIVGWRRRRGTARAEDGLGRDSVCSRIRETSGPNLPQPGLSRSRLRAGAHCGLALVALTTLAVTLAPWWIRNYFVIGHFVPTTLQVGASLRDGLHPDADGSSNMVFMAAAEQAERAHPSLPGEPLEYRLDRRLRQEAIDWAVAHPTRVIELAAIKFARTWNVWPNDPRQAGWALRIITAVTYLPALMLALVGIWRTRDRLWPVALCWLPALYVALLHVVFVGSVRYREPAMLGLLVVAAAGLRGGRSPSHA